MFLFFFVGLPQRVSPPPPPPTEDGGKTAEQGDDFGPSHHGADSKLANPASNHAPMGASFVFFVF